MVCISEYLNYFICSFNENNSFFIILDFPFDDEASTASGKRSYRSQNTNVERALSQQDKEVMLLEKIVGQNNEILEQLKKIADLLSSRKDINSS